AGVSTRPDSGSTPAAMRPAARSTSSEVLPAPGPPSTCHGRQPGRGAGGPATAVNSGRSSAPQSRAPGGVTVRRTSRTALSDRTTGAIATDRADTIGRYGPVESDASPPPA